MNIARSLRLASELPFIALSPPRETVISQWNYGSPFSRDPTAVGREYHAFATASLRIYVDVDAYLSPRLIITVIMSVTVTMIVIVVTDLAAIKGAYYGHPSLRDDTALGFSRYTSELSSGNILFRAETEYFSSKIPFK